MSYKKVYLKAGKEESLKRFHPWVFSGAIAKVEGEPEEGNWIELQDYVGRFGIEDRSLQKIYANLFGQKISKNQRLSNWEAETLTESQIKYAATDAWACVEIYKCLAEMERTGNYEVVKEMDDL